MKNSNRSSNAKIIIITVTILILITVIAILPNKIADNPAGTVGNTAGNLNNKGLFCENEGIVYFANAYDDGAIYRMNADETEIRKLVNAAAEYISVGGKYLYYYQTKIPVATGLGSFGSDKGLYRMSITGKKLTCLEKNILLNLNLVDNTLFYQRSTEADGILTQQLSTNKTDGRTVSAELINPACAQNGTIYYNGTEADFFLHTLNTLTGEKATLWEYDLFNPVLEGDYIYFMDVHQNYRLCRYSLSMGEMQVLSEERTDFFNVVQGMVYYQTNSQDSPALKRMSVDGGNVEIVREGVYQNINATSNYVYFNEFNSTVPVYKTNTLGTVNVTTFDAARDAVMENDK